MVTIDKARLIAQLKKDEGFSPKAFWDIKQWTFGYGCKASKGGDTITEPEASVYLETRTKQSIGEFNQMFSGHENKFNNVRAEAFINMLFNMGMGSQAHPERGGLYSFKNTLGLIFNYLEVDWAKVAGNLKESKWAFQVGDRATRIIKEISTGVKA